MVLAELGLEPEQAEAAYLDEALLSYADQPVPVFPVEELEERSESQAVSDETRALPRTQVLRSLGYWVFLVLGLSMFMDVVCTLPYSVCVALALVLATAAALQIGQAPRGARLQGPGLPVAAH